MNTLKHGQYWNSLWNINTIAILTMDIALKKLGYKILNKNFKFTSNGQARGERKAPWGWHKEETLTGYAQGNEFF